MANEYTEHDYARAKHIIKTMSDNNLILPKGVLPEKDYSLLWDTLLKLQEELKLENC